MTQAPDWADEAEKIELKITKYLWGIGSEPDIASALRTAYTRGRVEGLREAADLCCEDIYDDEGYSGFMYACDEGKGDRALANAVTDAVTSAIGTRLSTLADKIEREGRE